MMKRRHTCCSISPKLGGNLQKVVLCLHVCRGTKLEGLGKLSSGKHLQEEVEGATFEHE